MSKIIWLLLLLSMPLYAQSPVKSVEVPKGLTCYDDKNLKVIDDAQKRGINCEVKLKALQQQHDILKDQLQQSAAAFNVPVEKWHDSEWVQIAASLMIGVVVGVGIGVNL